MNRKARLQRLRRKMGLETIWCRPRRTSEPVKAHRKYPYLLRELKVTRPDQVWCADITYMPMPHGHAYLCAVMDWHSRKVLGWRVSNTMDAALCQDTLAAAVAQSSRLPEIFNTDQGSQFTSEQCTGALAELGIAISMDCKGRWMDNVFIERLWRSVKHEEIYLCEYATRDQPQNPQLRPLFDVNFLSFHSRFKKPLRYAPKHFEPSVTEPKIEAPSFNIDPNTPLLLTSHQAPTAIA